MYTLSDKVEFTAIIKHLNTSMAEGYPAYVQVITPPYMWFKSDDLASVACNYSVDVGGETEMVPQDKAGADIPGGAETDDMLLLKFPGGITYADIISLNFTMTVDPYEIRQKGSGVEEVAVVLVPVCEQQQIAGFPATAGDRTVCGEHQIVNVNVNAAGALGSEVERRPSPSQRDHLKENKSLPRRDFLVIFQNKKRVTLTMYSIVYL